MRLLRIVFFIILLLLYEKIWRPIICKKNIHMHINNLGGQVDNIERLTQRDEIYNVYYTVNGKLNNSIVKFNLFYKSKWN
ncbi:hypothetical protein FDE76_05465 [Clostridium botulinum]|uniref:Uncharacterized protein n=1 Tax=Clostridium botulinum (strain Eklund 17B / Type B) TaxID=935198 RepID=B2TNK5_CLOBB|nr:hypothetical protein CLL_A2624 [Clostridium botulinum B str. Eklund 17B (NRP)]MBY6976135.1 hypothetical protein [Clostridium botulinum]MBY7000558.1 hypothetical protein [Clostridium botulinum]NFD70417.1 hypothetical protein [Clostridium botulinum]NFF33392.1 hypothetical protein [Clostridium botulinum]